MTTLPVFTSTELIEKTGMPRCILQYCVRQGIVTPSIRYGKRGPGSEHIFSSMDALGVWCVQLLRPKNHTGAVMKKIAKFWHTQEGQELIAQCATGVRPEHGSILIINSAGDVVRSDDGSVKALLEQEDLDYAIVVDAFLLSQQLEASIKEHNFDPPGPSGRVPRKKKA